MNTREIVYYYSLYMHMNGLRFDADDDGGEQNNTKSTGEHFGTRIPYGLCKSAGIDVPEGTTPREAWDLLEGKTGIKGSEVYKGLKDRGKTVKEVVKEVKSKSEKPKSSESGDAPMSNVERGGRGSFEDKKRYRDMKRDRIRSAAKYSPEKVKEELDSYEPGTVVTVAPFKGWRPIAYVKGEDGNWSSFEYGHKRDIEKKRVVDELFTGDSDTISIYDKEINAKDIADKGIESEEDFEEFQRAIKADGAIYNDGERPYSYEDLGKAFPAGTVLSTYGRWMVKTDDGFVSSYYGLDKSDDSVFRDMEYYSSAKLVTKKDALGVPSGKDKNEKKSKDILTDPEKVLKGLKMGDVVDLEVDGKHLRLKRIRGGLSSGVYDKSSIEQYSGFIKKLNEKGLVKAEVYTDKKVVKTPEERAAERAEAERKRVEREERKAKATKPYEPTGAVHESPASLEHYDEHMKPVREALISKYGFTDDDVEFMESTLKTMFEKYDYLMRCPEGAVQKILDSHFMNQLESGTTRGAKAPELRRQVSHRLFGNSGSHSDDPDYFEKYGFCDSYENQRDNPGVSSGYGHVLIKFKKDRVAERTTYTADDSLTRDVDKVAGRAGSKPTFEGLTYNGTKRMLDKMRSMNGDVTPKSISGWYLELQYHGRLTMEDVEEICIPSRGTLSEKTINGLKEKGVKVYVTGQGYI